MRTLEFGWTTALVFSVSCSCAGGGGLTVGRVVFVVFTGEDVARAFSTVSAVMASVVLAVFRGGSAAHVSGKGVHGVGVQTRIAGLFSGGFRQDAGTAVGTHVVAALRNGNVTSQTTVAFRTFSTGINHATRLNLMSHKLRTTLHPLTGSTTKTLQMTLVRHQTNHTAIERISHDTRHHHYPKDRQGPHDVVVLAVVVAVGAVGAAAAKQPIVYTEYNNNEYGDWNKNQIQTQVGGKFFGGRNKKRDSRNVILTE